MLQIGEVATLLGITPKAIRHYHQLGLLDEPPRAENGYRLYGAAALERLNQIIRLQGFGLSLRKIRLVLSADAPDALLRQVLQVRHDAVSDEITRLQNQQSRIQSFLQGDVSLDTLKPSDDTPSSADTLHAVLKPSASHLADVIVASEGDVLAQLDGYQWSAGYTAFWHGFGQMLARQLCPHEHLFILWLERYMALATLPPDDWQAQAWLNELAHSPDRRVLARAWQLPPLPELPADELARLERLFPLLILAHGTPAQRAFVALLLD